jgi:hypothetical protein
MLQVKPEKNCNFDGFLGTWEFPEKGNWLSDSLKKFILFKLFFEDDFEVIQKGIIEKGLAFSDDEKSDIFFKTLIRNFMLFLDGSEFSKPQKRFVPDSRWINVEYDKEGYPVVTVPFCPSPEVEIAKYDMIFLQLKNDSKNFWLKNFYEPMELFFHELNVVLHSNIRF